VVTISVVPATTVMVMVPINIIVVTIQIVTTTLWFAEAMLENVDVTKSFSSCRIFHLLCSTFHSRAERKEARGNLTLCNLTAVRSHVAYFSAATVNRREEGCIRLGDS